MRAGGIGLHALLVLILAESAVTRKQATDSRRKKKRRRGGVSGQGGEGTKKYDVCGR